MDVLGKEKVCRAKLLPDTMPTKLTSLQMRDECQSPPPPPPKKESTPVARISNYAHYQSLYPEQSFYPEQSVACKVVKKVPKIYGT